MPSYVCMYRRVSGKELKKVKIGVMWLAFLPSLLMKGFLIKYVWDRTVAL